MIYVMLVAAVMTTALVTGICSLLNWRKVYIVAPLQFLGAFAVTYFVGPYMARDLYAGDALLIAVAISAAMPMVFIIMRIVVGRLDRPRAGGLVKHRQERADSAGT